MSQLQTIIEEKKKTTQHVNMYWKEEEKIHKDQLTFWR